jgi:hypothetical protein
MFGGVGRLDVVYNWKSGYRYEARVIKEQKEPAVSESNGM